MKNKKSILLVIGTRPNFIKITQFRKAINDFPQLDLKIVHTGQHSGAVMADIFFSQFNVTPDYFLNTPAATPNQQIGHIITELDKLIITIGKPSYMMVVGDVNSTLAGAIVANKQEIPLMHLESGLRSFDNTMPEEHNRIITDAITQHYFVTEQQAIENLLKEGKAREQLYFVGNTMIDTLVAFQDQIDKSNCMETYNIKTKEFVLITMHRPATVDVKEGLQKLITLLSQVAQSYKIVFPIHPRTRNNFEKFNLQKDLAKIKNLLFTEPLDYFAFQQLTKNAAYVITDSGGVQEETTYYQVPCLTLRNNTERPVTCTEGTNTLCNFENIEKYIQQIVQGNYKTSKTPYLWDGKATQRIVEAINGMN